MDLTQLTHMKFKSGRPNRKDFVDGVQVDIPQSWVGWDDKTWERQAGQKTFAGVSHTIIIESTVTETGAPPQISEIRILGSNDGLSAEEAEAFRSRYFLAIQKVLGCPSERIYQVDAEFPGVERSYCLWPSEQSLCVAGVAFSFEQVMKREGYVEYVTCSVALSRALENPLGEHERRERLALELRGRRT